jgi:AMMECR1 domain-containing protein
MRMLIPKPSAFVVVALGVAGALLPVGVSAKAAERSEGPSLSSDRPAAESAQGGLTLAAKRAIARHAYGVLDSHYADASPAPPSGGGLAGFAYDRLYVTCYHGTRLRGSQSGSTPSDAPDRLFRDIEEAVGECVEDKRFGGKITPGEIAETSLVFNFVRNETRLPVHDLKGLKKSIELGIHAVRVRRGGKTAFFKESVAISKNYSHAKLFKRLCKKAKLPKTCYTDPDTAIYRYDAVTFRTSRAGEIADLYRYDLLIPEDEVTARNTRTRLNLAYDWFLNQVNPETGRVEYKYFPSKDRYSESQNHVRALASVWSMAEAGRHLGRNELDDAIKETLAHYLTFETERDGVAYLEVDGKAKLAYSAFLVLSLLALPEFPESERLAARFAEGLLFQQNGDGSFRTYFFSPRNTGVDYYPGEAMLALIRLHDVTGDQRYLAAVQQAFPYYREHWRQNKSTAFVPWHTQVYTLLFERTGDRQLAEFVFEMNDWVIGGHQITESRHPDEIGGFPRGKPRYSTASYLEGIIDAYALAAALGDDARARRYRHSVRLGTRFLFQLQITERNAFYLRNPRRAIGGVRHSLTRNDQRVDFTQHAVLVLIKALENGVFSGS